MALPTAVGNRLPGLPFGDLPRPNYGGRNRPPTNLLQAYGNMGGKLPGMTYTRLPSGFGAPGEWGYQGSHPVGLGQAYQNMGGKLPIPPAAPKAPGGASGGGGGSPGSSSLDAQYFANVAANQAKINSLISGFQEQQGLANTAYQNQIGTLNYQQPRQQLSLEQKANAAGSLYSSAEGQRQGDLVTQFGDRRSAATQSNALKQADLTSRIAGARASEGQYENSQAWASALRASVAAGQNPPPGNTPAGASGGASPGAGVPQGYWGPGQQLAASLAAAKQGGVGSAPKGMPAAGRVLNFNGQHYRASYDAAGQIKFTRVGGGKGVNLAQAYQNLGGAPY